MISCQNFFFTINAFFESFAKRGIAAVKKCLGYQSDDFVSMLSVLRFIQFTILMIVRGCFPTILFYPLHVTMLCFPTILKSLGEKNVGLF